MKENSLVAQRKEMEMKNNAIVTHQSIIADLREELETAHRKLGYYEAMAQNRAKSENNKRVDNMQ